jgi:DNA-binding NarL/FixJ family response regulator
VALDVYESLRPRIAAVLAADDITVAQNGASGSADVRVIGVNLSEPISLRRLKEMLAHEHGPIVAVSPFCGALGLRRAVKAGADSLVLEEDLEDALVPALRAVAAGLSVMPADLWQGSGPVALSHREREVLRLAVTGRTNAEIAKTLFLAESTVKSHLSSAYRKLGAGGRNDAASMIFDPDEGLASMILGTDGSASPESIDDGIPAA